MKHLLTALIATLFLILPLHADEPTQTISVRVVDHEDKPISGLALYAKVGSARADSVTDSSGLASFTIQAQPDVDSVWIWPFDSSFIALRRVDADAAQPEPDPGVLSQYAFDRVTRFDLEDFAEGPVTIRAPESLQCMVRMYVSGISAAGPFNWGLQCRGDTNLRWSRPGVGLYVGSDEKGSYLRSSLPIARHQPATIALFAQGLFHLVEIDAEQTTRGIAFVAIENVDGQSIERFGFADFSAVPKGEIRCPLDEDTTAIRFCLIPVDGEHAREVWLMRRLARTANDGQTHQRHATARVPSGEYFIYPLNRDGMYWERGAFGLDYWSPGSVFDTMLRLRRGEDLPHLKRITIPEGGTVELSSEDFLDPPAEAEADQP